MRSRSRLAEENLNGDGTLILVGTFKELASRRDGGNCASQIQIESTEECCVINNQRGSNSFFLPLSLRLLINSVRHRASGMQGHIANNVAVQQLTDSCITDHAVHGQYEQEKVGDRTEPHAHSNAPLLQESMHNAGGP